MGNPLQSLINSASSSLTSALSAPPTNVSPALQPYLLWPIKVKGAIDRHNPAGDPTIEKAYHAALEDGRWLEKNVADANHWLLQKKQQYIAKVQTYFDMNKLAVDGQLSDRPRAVKYIADSIKFLQEVNQFQKEIIGVIQAAEKNIALLIAMEQNLLGLIQSVLNSLAVLLNNICNWGLPRLPSIPNLFPDTIWNWNGFKMSPLALFAALKPHIAFSTSFAFSQCFPINTGANTTVPPSSVTTYSGLMMGTPQISAPLDGISVTGLDLTNSTVISALQALTTPPAYLDFNPNSSMFGAVPDPATIISNYQMPAATYQSNIVSITPVLRGDTVEPGDPDYNNPDFGDRGNTLRADLVHFINLDNVVASNYDPYITSAWLFYLGLDRTGRAGTWLANFQNVYHTYIQPSLDSLANNDVPWNTVINGPGTVSTPKDIPFTDVLKAMTTPQLQTTLWKLTYVEAALLGYTRSKTWDGYQDANYLSSVTGADLDYVPTAVNYSVTTTVTLGEGMAEFPSPCTFPTAMTATFNQVVAQATIDIQNDTMYQSPRLAGRFTYNQFAIATEVDRFTQFWRDFAANMVALLAQDPYLIQFAATYFGTLNGALNPLGDPTAYSALKVDVASRNRSWTPGTPLLTIPVAPVTSYSNSSTPTTSTGWQGITFDPTVFLARPDIQGQPMPVQLAMLRTNLSYAGVLQTQQQAIGEIQNQIANAQAVLAQSQQFGFSVEAVVDSTIVPAGSPGTTVSFDYVDFDLTGNVTNATTFTLQSTGEYALFGGLYWEGTDTNEARTVTVFQNGVPILTQSTDPTFTAPLLLQFTYDGNFSKGDVIQVRASHNFVTDQTVGPTSFFSMVQSGPTETPVQIPASSTGNTATFTADTNMLAMTAFDVLSDGHITNLDPTVVTGMDNATITNIQISGNILTVTAANTFVAGGTIYNFSGLTTATFLNGQTVTIQTASGTQFTAQYTHADYPSAPDTGTANGGPINFPYADGITLASVTSGNIVNCAVVYGGINQVAGASLTVGELLYVGLNGVLTQDYNSLLTTVQWIICVGRAIDIDTFLYEPHIPNRIVPV